MALFSNFPFQNSDPVNPSVEDLQYPYFNSLPVRMSRYNHVAVKATTQCIAGVSSGFAQDRATLALRGTLTPRGDAASWIIPEVTPEKMAAWAGKAEIIFFLDDILDSTDLKSQDTIRDDIALSVLYKVKLGKTVDTDFGLSKAWTEVVSSLINLGLVRNGSSNMNFLQDACLSIGAAHSAQPHCGMTFEEYTQARIISSTVKYLFRLLPTLYDLHVSEEELASVSRILEPAYRSMALSNDFYSFHREFDDLARSGNTDAMHNAVALLMTNYGYNEEEAGNILKQEVLTAEKDLLDQLHIWENSPVPKSDDIHKYAVFGVLLVGGFNYWQSQSPRYHQGDLSTTREDRAGLIGQYFDRRLRLKGYPPPADPKYSTPLEVNEGLRDNSCSNKTTKNGTPATYTSSTATESPKVETLLLGPFVKAPAQKICMAPFDYTGLSPGKNTLCRFIDSLAPWLPLSPETLEIIKSTVSMIFTSSLMVDDIQDGSQLRRGQPAAYTKYGIGQTVNSATYAASRAVLQVKENLKPKCGEILIDALDTLCLGQGLDLHWTFNRYLPSVDEYIAMVDSKTGAFFRLALHLLEAETGSGNDEELSQLFTLIGRYYQIADDYKNLVSEEYTAKKGFCDDLEEGKFSFPLIHMLQNSPNADAIHEMLLKCGKDSDRSNLSTETKTHILGELENAGSLEYTRNILDFLFERMMEASGHIESRRGVNKKLKILILVLKL